MRHVAILVAAAVAAMPVATSAAPAKAAPDYAAAYDHAVRCFVVSGINKDRVGSRAAFDAALRLGQLQGLSNAEINVGLDWAIPRETENIRRDPTYKERILARCRQLGFAS